MKRINQIDYYSRPEVAALFNVTKQTVKAWATKGYFKQVIFGTHFYYDQVSVRDYLNSITK